MANMQLARRSAHSRLRSVAAILSTLTAMLVVSSSLLWTASAETEPTLEPLIQRSLTMDGVGRDYWVYLPKNYAHFRVFDPKDNPLVIVLHPDGMDGETYANHTAWMRLAEERDFIVAFPSAHETAWNARLDETGPDDVQFVNAVTTAMQSDWKSNRAFTYVVGEGSGAAIANAVAATHARNYVAVASLGGAAPSGLWSDTTGLISTHMAAWHVSVGRGLSAEERAQIDYWKSQNGVAGPTTGAAGFGFGRTSVAKNPDNSLAQVRVTHVKDVSALRSAAVTEAIYDNIFRPTLRFSDQDSTNGTLVPFKSNEDLGLREYRETFGGVERRWYVYVPKQYNKLNTGGRELPVVMVFHGRNGSGRWVDQQTQWSEVAEDRGFIAVFLHALHPEGALPNSNFGFSTTINPNNQDVPVALGVLEDVTERFAVDTGRVFLTGVSQGASFTQRLAVQYPERFAAIAPCYSGHLGASAYQDTTVVRRDVPLPVWQCAGVNELPSEFPGSTSAARIYWQETVNQHVGPATVEVDERYRTEIYTDGLAEYRWTDMDDIGHFMPAGLSYKIWDELFAHYERLPDGSLRRS